MKPKRIQRKRIKGWKMPSNAVYVGRPTKWGNPYRVGDKFRVLSNGEYCYGEFDLDTIISLYEDWIKDKIRFKKLNIKELKGKDLACWCPLDKPCHADILIKLAN